MNLAILLDMAASGAPDRLAVGRTGSGFTYAELRRHALVAAELIMRAGAPRVVYLGGNSELFPLTLFAAAAAQVPIVPINYRLGTAQLTELLNSQPAGTLVVYDRQFRLPEADVQPVTTDEWTRQILTTRSPARNLPTADPGIAVLLYTSGTSATPKAAVLRHQHLMSYILNAVEFASASDTEATLVTVPPYHIAGVATILSNLYAGRRIVYLDRFEPAAWLALAHAEKVTNAMLVPTMLARIVYHLDAHPGPVPPIVTLAYGGARMPLPVIERALALFPDAGFVNAYGLTETSSTIAVLGPQDHRDALSSINPAVRTRLASAGRPVPGLEVQIRSEDGRPLPTDQVGELWVRGPQVSGEYLGLGTVTDTDGWFPTKDLARADAEGYLFIEGRLDDTIIRGGENISPAEIEDVILRHPHIAECVVVGPSDDEWGQRLAAVIVPTSADELDVNELTTWIGARLRSSKTPDEIHIWPELPQTDTGKIVRRRVLAALTGDQPGLPRFLGPIRPVS